MEKEKWQQKKWKQAVKNYFQQTNKYLIKDYKALKIKIQNSWKLNPKNLHNKLSVNYHLILCKNQQINLNLIKKYKKTFNIKNNHQ